VGPTYNEVYEIFAETLKLCLSRHFKLKFLLVHFSLNKISWLSLLKCPWFQKTIDLALRMLASFIGLVM